MSRRSSIALVALVGLAACGGAEPHDETTPSADTAACPSETSPERCRDLAEAAASSNKNDLAWAYTVLECQSPGASQCATMWQRYAKAAPTQTDALNVLHAACDHSTAACETLAAWHTQRGHTLAAAAYQKRVDAARQGVPTPPAAAKLAIATDLAAAMRISDGAPRTDSLNQMVGRQLRVPVMKAVAAAKLHPKAWSMHAATLGTGDDSCTATSTLDRHPVPLTQCVSEVRPFDADQIAIRNRCGQAVNITYVGARADQSTFVKQIRLEPYEAMSAGISHRELGPLTYAVCPGECRVTSAPDDVTGSWTGQDDRYYCLKGSH